MAKGGLSAARKRIRRARAPAGPGLAVRLHWAVSDTALRVVSADLVPGALAPQTTSRSNPTSLRCRRVIASAAAWGSGRGEGGITVSRLRKRRCARRYRSAESRMESRSATRSPAGRRPLTLQRRSSRAIPFREGSSGPAGAADTGMHRLPQVLAQTRVRPVIRVSAYIEVVAAGAWELAVNRLAQVRTVVSRKPRSQAARPTNHRAG